MRILLATGIYPPDIGGPATYASELAAQMHADGHDVTVVTYAPLHKRVRQPEERWMVVEVARTGNVWARMRRFAKALRAHGETADIVYVFSSISCGVPLRMARLKRPKKVLRLGGDFFWERYTDRGGTMGLDEWYGSWQWLRMLTHRYMTRLLRTFDHIVFSTAFQYDIYRRHYRSLPPHSVIENALPAYVPAPHAPHEPFRLLFIGRFVGFKNLFSLVHAAADMPDTMLTLTGEGPCSLDLVALSSSLNLNDRLTFLSPVHGAQKDALFAEHDLLIIPSFTEISPNVALEARGRGLPVLLSDRTGLSLALREGMMVLPLRTPEEIVSAVNRVRAEYGALARMNTLPFKERSWSQVYAEHKVLFSSLA